MGHLAPCIYRKLCSILHPCWSNSLLAPVAWEAVETEEPWDSASGQVGDMSTSNILVAGVVVKWGPPDFGAPHPQITRDLGLGGPI